MRATRANEVRNLFGEYKEKVWIGHSQQVAEAHYFYLSDHDFALAASPELTPAKSKKTSETSEILAQN